MGEGLPTCTERWGNAHASKTARNVRYYIRPSSLLAASRIGAKGLAFHLPTHVPILSIRFTSGSSTYLSTLSAWALQSLRSLRVANYLSPPIHGAGIRATQRPHHSTLCGRPIQRCLAPLPTTEAHSLHASFWLAPSSPWRLYPFPIYTRYAPIPHSSADCLPTINERTSFATLLFRLLCSPSLHHHSFSSSICILTRYDSFPAPSVSTRWHEPKDCECVCQCKACNLRAVPRRARVQTSSPIQMRAQNGICRR